MVVKNIIAVIPARGGSKRIPKKNILEVLGKPMIAWTIEEALKSKFITEVVVSTDDLEIAEVSRSYGASVPFLRSAHADDFSPVSEATINCVKDYCKLNETPDIVVQLMANCPNRDAQDIDESIAQFIEKSRSFQISCFKYGWMNPWWAHTLNDDGIATSIFDNSIKFKRSQDQPDLYCPTGAIWIAQTDELFESGTFYGPNHSFHEISWEAAVDIDDYSDLKMAKILMSDKSN